MTTDHLDIWHKLERTDPDQVKAFQRPGGFKGTAIKPMYCLRKMTEAFGPCGKGWGMHAPTFETVHVGEEVAVYCTVGLWWGTAEDCHAIVGVGGDMVVKRTRNGLMVDDEAFKKAYTDALTNAMKHLGMSADVHMGLFDDSKYVAELRRESHAEASQDTTKPREASPRRETTPAPDEPVRVGTGYQIMGADGRVLGQWDDVMEWFDAIAKVINGCKTADGVKKVAEYNRPVTKRILREHHDDNNVRDQLGLLGDLIHSRISPEEGQAA